MNKGFLMVLWVLAGWMIVSGCFPSDVVRAVQTDLPVQVIHATAHCGGRDTGPAVSWISGPDMLAEAMGPGRSLILGSEKTAVPVVDFEVNGVLHVSLGRKPTTGYGIDRGHVSATVENRIATVYLKTVAPKRGALTAQMLTHPCVLIRMPRGDYSRIRVMDHNGKIMGDVAVALK